VGAFIDVKVASNRSESKTGSKAPAVAEAANDPASAKTPADPAAEKSDDSKNILKSLPSLEPIDNHAALMTSMKMQIMERFDNGDVLVMHRRRSMRDGQASEIIVTSRLPAVSLSKQDQVSTNDLVDVDWKESFDGEVAERKSANWEDEYTLRLSGFEETKSKRAMAVEEKREQLKSARDKLEKDMKLHIADRDQMTKERATLLEDKSKSTQKISELEAANNDLRKKLGEESPEIADNKDDAKKTDKKVDAKQADKKSGDKKTDTKVSDKKPDAKKPDAKK
jgi:hypothetical protein